MAAIAKYIVKRVFEHEGTQMKIGEELVLDSRQADPLFQKGLLTGEQFLDPEHPKDAAKIKEVKEKLAAKKAKDRGEVARRKEAKQEIAAEKDDQFAAKRAEIKAMVPADAIDKDDQEKSIDRMTESQLDRKKQSLEEKQPDEEESDVETPEKPDTPTQPGAGTKSAVK